MNLYIKQWKIHSILYNVNFLVIFIIPWVSISLTERNNCSFPAGLNEFFLNSGAKGLIETGITRNRVNVGTFNPYSYFDTLSLCLPVIKINIFIVSTLTPIWQVYEYGSKNLAIILIKAGHKAGRPTHRDKLVIKNVQCFSNDSPGQIQLINVIYIKLF